MKETVLSAEKLPEDYRVGFEDGELEYERKRIRQEFIQLLIYNLDAAINFKQLHKIKY
jgi:predicted nucleic acid-binding Zn ribbon protein